jgi:cobalamin biosynthetic protein CobC
MSGPADETIVHGGDLDAARARFLSAPEPWIDLSTGINPYAYPFAPPAAETWQRLPQASAERAALEAAAMRYGAADAGVLVASPGSQALIQIIPRLIDDAEVAVLGPTYAEHAGAWARCGHRVRDVATLDEVGDARVIVVVNPNNPTGRIVAADDLRRAAEGLAHRGGLLVVDEAFADFAAPGISLIPQLLPATVVLRSFGKAYGLAGVRLGFAAAHADIAHRIRAALGPWAVSGPALSIGAQALADAQWLEQTRSMLSGDCRRLDALLAAYGAKLEGGTHLFRLVSHPQARDVADALGRDGILVRRFTTHPQWLRFGIPNSNDAWHRLELSMLNNAPHGGSQPIARVRTKESG